MRNEPRDHDIDDPAALEPAPPGALRPPGDAKLSIPMRARDAFYARVTQRLRRSLAPELQRFTARPMFNIMKVAYDNERIHYEVVLDVSRRWLEIGLHFEDGPASTIAYLAHFDGRIVELKDLLGPEIEIERWTQSWGRIYELWPLDGVDQAVADRVADRLAAYVSTLQPIVESLGIPPERMAAPRRTRR